MKINNVELKTVFNYVLIKLIPEEENPLKAIKTKSGLQISSKGLEFTARGDGDGFTVNNDLVMTMGIVMEIGEKVETLKVGDYVCIDKRTCRMLPVVPDSFDKLELYQTNESNIIGYIPFGERPKKKEKWYKRLFKVFN